MECSSYGFNIKVQVFGLVGEYEMENAKYSQSEETEIVCDAMILTATIEYEKEKLDVLRREEFKKAKPMEPIKRKAKPEHVEPPQNIPALPYISFKEYTKQLGLYPGLIIGGIGCWILIGFIFEDHPILELVFLVVGIIIYIRVASWIVKLFKKRWSKKSTEILLASDYNEKLALAKADYENRKKAANDAALEKQKIYDEKYEEELNHYNTVVIKNYNHEVALWKEKNRPRLAFYNKRFLEMKKFLIFYIKLHI